MGYEIANDDQWKQDTDNVSYACEIIADIASASGDELLGEAEYALPIVRAAGEMLTVIRALEGWSRLPQPPTEEETRIYNTYGLEKARKLIKELWG